MERLLRFGSWQVDRWAAAGFGCALALTSVAVFHALRADAQVAQVMERERDVAGNLWMQLVLGSVPPDQATVRVLAHVRARLAQSPVPPMETPFVADTPVDALWAGRALNPFYESSENTPRTGAEARELAESRNEVRLLFTAAEPLVRHRLARAWKRSLLWAGLIALVSVLWNAWTTIHGRSFGAPAFRTTEPGT